MADKTSDPSGFFDAFAQNNENSDQADILMSMASEPPQNRFGRKIKSNSKFNDDILGDREIQKASKQMARKKPIKSSQPTSNAPSAVGKKATATAAGAGPKAGPVSAELKHATPFERKQHAIEESVIARTSSLKDRQLLHWSYANRLLPEGPQECPDIATAVKLSIKQSTKLLTDWRQQPARYIGKTCKVYWDGDRTWFYARILYYDSHHDRHFVYYLVDATAEWLVLNKETVMVAGDIVMVKKGQSAWPAMQYWVSPSARDVVAKMKGAKKGHEYIEYFAETDSGKRDYEFVNQMMCLPISEAANLAPKKNNQAYFRTLDQARQEQEHVDTTVNSVLSYIRKNIHIINSGEDWIGIRVRATTHHIPWQALLDDEKERAAQEARERQYHKLEKQKGKMNIRGPSINLDNIVPVSRRRGEGNGGSGSSSGGGGDGGGEDTAGDGRNDTNVSPDDMSRCMGTIAQYCPSLDKHLVVFDEAFLQPKWVRVGPEDVDVLIGPPSGSSHSATAESSLAYLRSQAEKSHEYCDLCGCGQEHIDVDVKLLLKKCAVCEHSYHPYCLPEADRGDPVPVVRHTKSIAELKQVNNEYKRSVMEFVAKSESAPADDAGASAEHRNSSSSAADAKDLLGRELIIYPSSSSASSSEASTSVKTEPETDSSKPPPAPPRSRPLILHKGEVLELVEEEEDSDEIQEKDMFVCWKCIPCDICGPGASAWNRPLHCWKLNRAQDNAPDDPRPLCGECIWRFKHQKDFCPVCFKLYPPEVEVPQDPFPGDGAGVPPNLGEEKDKSAANASEFRAEASALPAPMEVEEEGIDGEEAGDAPLDAILPATEAAATGSAIMMAAASAAASLSAAAAAGAVVVAAAPTSKYQAPQEHIIIKEDTNAMVQCNECNRWVHALCEGIDQTQYEAMTRGTHPVWGDEYLCPICRVSAAQKMINKLGVLDKTSIFAFPVTELQAKHYYDIIRNPMDLKTMCDKANRGQYKSLQSLRQDFELMVLNALVFNKEGDEYFLDALAFHEAGLKMFKSAGRHTNVSTYGVELEEMSKERQRKKDEIKRTEQESVKEKSKQKVDADLEAIQSRYLQQYYTKVSHAKGIGESTEGSAAGGAGTRTTRRQGSGSASSAEVQARLSRVLGSNVADVEELSGSESDKEAAAAAAASRAGGASEEERMPHRWDLSLQQKQPDADVVAPSTTLEIVLPTELSPAPEPNSYIAPFAMLLAPEEAYYMCVVDHCLLCGSSGSGELMLLCADCGECFHSFCVDAPFASMSSQSRRDWLCTNCKGCEHCGTASETDASPLLYCEICDKAYHGACLEIPVNHGQAAAISMWVCEECTFCKEPACAGRNSVCGKDKAENGTDSGAIPPKLHWGASADICYICKQEKDIIVKAERTKREELELKSRLTALQSEFLQTQKYATCSVCQVNCENSFIICGRCKLPSHATCTSVRPDADTRDLFTRAMSANELTDNWLANSKYNAKTFKNYCCYACLREMSASDSESFDVRRKIVSVQRQRLVNQQARDVSGLIATEAKMAASFEEHRPLLQAVMAWATERIVWLCTGESYEFLANQLDLAIADHINRRTPVWLMQRARRFLALWRNRGLNSREQVLMCRAHLARGRSRQGTDLNIESLTRYASMAAAFIAYTQKEMDRHMWQNTCLPDGHPLKHPNSHLNFPVIYETEAVVKMLSRYINSGSVLAGDFHAVQVGLGAEVFAFEPTNASALLAYRNSAISQRVAEGNKHGKSPYVPASQMHVPEKPKARELLQDGTPAVTFAPWDERKYQADLDIYNAAVAAKAAVLEAEQTRARSVASEHSLEKREALFQLLVFMVEILVTPPCDLRVTQPDAVSVAADLGISLASHDRGVKTFNPSEFIGEEKTYFQPITLSSTKYLPQPPRSSLLGMSTSSAFPDPKIQPYPSLLKIWHKELEGVSQLETKANHECLRALGFHYRNEVQRSANVPDMNNSMSGRSRLLGGSANYISRPDGFILTTGEWARVDELKATKRSRISTSAASASVEELSAAAAPETAAGSAVVVALAPPEKIAAAPSPRKAAESSRDLLSDDARDALRRNAKARESALRLHSVPDVRFISTCTSAGDSWLGSKSRKHRERPWAPDDERRELGTFDGGSAVPHKYADIIASNLASIEMHYVAHVLPRDTHILSNCVINDDDNRPIMEMYVSEEPNLLPGPSNPGKNRVTFPTDTELAIESAVPMQPLLRVPNAVVASPFALLPAAERERLERNRFGEHGKRAVDAVYKCATLGDNLPALPLMHPSTDAIVLANNAMNFSMQINKQWELSNPTSALRLPSVSDVRNYPEIFKEVPIGTSSSGLSSTTTTSTSTNSVSEMDFSLTHADIPIVSKISKRARLGDRESESAPALSGGLPPATMDTEDAPAGKQPLPLDSPRPAARQGQNAESSILVPKPLRGLGAHLSDAVPVEDTRFCLFCRKPEMTGQQGLLLGRLLPMGYFGPGLREGPRIAREEDELLNKGQTYAHVNCVRWSAEVVEKDSHLLDCLTAKNRGLKSKCSHCGGRGATLTCNERSCKRTFHLECAVACNCTLMEALAYKWPKNAENSRGYDYRPRPSEKDLEEATQRQANELHTFTLCPEHANHVSILPNSSGDGDEKTSSAQLVFHSTKLNRRWKPDQPRRTMLVHGVDHKVTSDFIAKELSLGKARRDGCSTAVRMGGLTVLHIGIPRIDLTGFHTADHIFPHGYRASRIFWSMTRPLQRTVYVFEILTENDFDGSDCDLRDYVAKYAMNLRSDSSLEHAALDLSPRESGLNGKLFSQSAAAAADGATPDTSLMPVFRVSMHDNASKVIITRTIESAYEIIASAVEKCNRGYRSASYMQRRGAAAAKAAANEALEAEDEDASRFGGADSSVAASPSDHADAEMDTGKEAPDSENAASEAVSTIENASSGMKIEENFAEAAPAKASALRDKYGTNAYHFFGVGMPFVRKALEMMRESVAAVIAPPPSPQYRPVYRLPSFDDAFRLQQLQMSVTVQEPMSLSGSARADGIEIIAKRSSGTRITKLLTKNVDAASSSGTSGVNVVDGSGATPDNAVAVDPSAIPADPSAEADESKLIAERNRSLYLQLSEAYLRDPNGRLEVRKSHIHNWGLFTKSSFSQNEMIVEYIGEQIRQSVADFRENRYEAEGVGSCYLFRLDKDDIVDATRTGGMARFMNHCCEPNAYAKLVSTDEQGFDKHIIIFAARDIQAYEEVTYDYKFPIEEKKLRCYCGATKCRGSMN